MKTLTVLSLLLCAAAFAQTNNINEATLLNYRVHTLTTTIDTADVLFLNSDRYSYHTLSIATVSSGADTVTVYVQSADTLAYAQTSVIDKSTGSSVTSIPATTTPKEYIIFDAWKQKVRIISSSKDGSSTRFVLGVK